MIEPSAHPPSQVGADRLGPWLAAAACAVLLATFLAFVTDTRAVRLACSDDVDNQRMTRDGTIATHFVASAQEQGRFYYAVPGHVIPYRLYNLDGPWLFSAVRAGLLFVSLGLLGWLCGRVAANAALGWMTALFAAAALHVPATFFAVLSFPTMMVGLGALLASLHLHLTHVRRNSPIAACASGLLLLLACQYIEVFVIFFPVFVALSWRAGARSLRALLRSLIAPLTAAAGYVAVYALFRLSYPSTYGGTQLSLDPRSALDVLFRLTYSVAPPFELFAHRTNPSGGGAFLKTAAEIQALLGGVDASRIALVLGQAAVVAALAWRSIRTPAAIGGGAIVFAFACMPLPNLPVSVAAKYQIWVHQRGFPYIYSFYSYCCLVFGLVCLAHWIAARRRTARGARRWITGFSVACSALFFSAQASNRNALQLLHAWYNDRPAAARSATP
ncbi:MAG TPA: hypothetical protein VM029_21445 [Opitutaceae bacterium]|nr:hypothetical protein [Opitutaceae bacterium]